MNELYKLNDLILQPKYRKQVAEQFKNGLRDKIQKKFAPLSHSKELTFQEFKENYRDKNQPVIFDGLLEKWKAFKEWNFDYLLKTFEKTIVTVNGFDVERKTRMTFGEYYNKVKDGKVNPDSGPLYIQEWYVVIDKPEIKSEFEPLSIQEYDFVKKINGINTLSCWIGQRQGITDLHVDLAYQDVIMAQISGSKQWSIFSPDSQVRLNSSGEIDWDNFLDSPRSVISHFVLKPGEVVYLPANWYHRVELLDDCISLGMPSLDEKNLNHYWRGRLQEFLPMALNAEYLKENMQDKYDMSFKRMTALAQLHKIDLKRLR